VKSLSLAYNSFIYSKPNNFAFIVEKITNLLDNASTTIFFLPYLYMIIYRKVSINFTHLIYCRFNLPCHFNSTWYIVDSTYLVILIVLATCDLNKSEILLVTSSVDKSSKSSPMHKAPCCKLGSLMLHH